MRGLHILGSRFMELCQRQSIFIRTLAPVSLVPRRRYSSTTYTSSGASIDIESIKSEMLARPPQLHLDTMHATNSQLLSLAMSDFLPRRSLKRHDHFRRANETEYLGTTPDMLQLVGDTLPPGHHLVYFPLRLAGSNLCPDGTDPYHSPSGTAFTRRMWAGGSVEGMGSMSLNGKRTVCLERIVDVAVRGSAGADKIFVEVLRQYIPEESLDMLYDAEAKKLTEGENFDGISERRTLVFMRELSNEEKEANLKHTQRIVKPPNTADYAETLTPTPTLLFHYSALTYNAHRIHLDRSYCREVEGHRDLLVHGPLSLTLMLSVLRSRLAHNNSEHVDRVDYRHLAPLYVGEPMRICVALRKPQDSGASSHDETSNGESKYSKLGWDEDQKSKRKKWDIWVENHVGSLCVRGTAETT
ncbi:hypothetical protein F5Y19DRAFT_410136 [Xylariaceae sp. FL1651]|nr:hypothetical protein F5Y19DRAFT_410136 [Xylariaceae sp. FL1651]